MSQITRQEVLAKKRDRYALAGKEHKTKIINELVELFGYLDISVRDVLIFNPVNTITPPRAKS